MNELDKSQPADEELTPAQELSVALIRMADALLLFAKYVVCQDTSLAGSPADMGTVTSVREDRVTVPCVRPAEPQAPTLAPNSTLHSAHSTLTPAPVSKADLRSFLMTKDKDAVRKLFTEFSVTKFSEIPEDRYPEVMAKAQDLPDKEAA